MRTSIVHSRVGCYLLTHLKCSRMLPNAVEGGPQQFAAAERWLQCVLIQAMTFSLPRTQPV